VNKDLSDGDYVRATLSGCFNESQDTSIKEHKARIMSISRRLDYLDKIERIGRLHRRIGPVPASATQNYLRGEA